MSKEIDTTFPTELQILSTTPVSIGVVENPKDIKIGCSCFITKGVRGVKWLKRTESGKEPILQLCRIAIPRGAIVSRRSSSIFKTNIIVLEEDGVFTEDSKLNSHNHTPLIFSKERYIIPNIFIPHTETTLKQWEPRSIAGLGLEFMIPSK